MLQRLRYGWQTARAWLYCAYAWSVFVLLAAPLWCAVALARRPSLGRSACHSTSRALLRLIGMPWHTINLSHLPARNHVLVANHASYLDVVFLAAALPPRAGHRFVAKRELACHWLPRLFCQGIGTLFVERFEVRRGVEDVEAMVEALSRGDNLIVFAEGTFSRESGLRPFRTGAFAAAARAGTPVATAGLRGVRAILRDRAWLPRRGRVEFEIGATLAPTGDDWAAAIRLRDAARTEILRLCEEPDLEASHAMRLG
jgi:1-acyl-sn-glycerol-3-phosphate acyltransferase